MFKLSKLLVLISTLGYSCLPQTAVARVFRMTEENTAPYFRATYGNSLIKKTHFEGTSGTGASVDDSVLLNQGGELGVVFTAPKVGLRLGLEMISHNPISDVQGKNGGGTALYDFESKISGLIPKVGVDLGLRIGDTWRVALGLAYGVGTVSYKNSYTLNAAGQAAYPGIADYSEEGSGTATLSEVQIFYETLMSDTTTANFELGYRNFDAEEFKYKSAITDLDGNAHAKNDVVSNSDATKKSADFSGPYIGVAFRFYLGK